MTDYDDESLKREANHKLRRAKVPQEVDPKSEVEYQIRPDGQGGWLLGIIMRLRDRQPDPQPPEWLKR